MKCLSQLFLLQPRHKQGIKGVFDCPLNSLELHDIDDVLPYGSLFKKSKDSFLPSHLGVEAELPK